eukprot:1160488-Pelagomonas_calceolata.AAC.2
MCCNACACAQGGGREGRGVHRVSPHESHANARTRLQVLCYAMPAHARREAAEKAGEFTESALMGAMPMHVPDFKTVIMPATVAALDEWKHEAVKSETRMWLCPCAAVSLCRCCATVSMDVSESRGPWKSHAALRLWTIVETCRRLFQMRHVLLCCCFSLGGWESEAV